MLPSWYIARQSFLGRRSRTALLIAAVAMASTLVVMVSCGIASMQGNIEHRLERVIGRTDARLLHRYAHTFDGSILQTVRNWPGVRAAAGRLSGSITLTRADGAVKEDGQPARSTVRARGVDTSIDSEFDQGTLSAGRWPINPGEIVIDPLTASQLDAVIGDRLLIERFGEPIQLEVVGLLDRPILGALQRPRVRIDRNTLAEATGRGGTVSVISIILDEDVDVRRWCEIHAKEVQEPMILEPTEMIRSGMDRQIRATRIGFIIVAMMAFLSCAFIVSTGMTTAVTEQQRQLGIVRCIGGSRAQVFAGQVWVGLLICTIGVMIGIPLGIGLAAGFAAWYSHILKSGLSISSLGICLAIAGAMLAGLFGALYPAWRASSVTPLTALTVRARAARARGVITCGVIGILLVTAQAIIFLGLPDDDARFWMQQFIGLPMMFGGYFLLAVVILVLIRQPAQAILSRLFRLPRGLLSGSLAATPYRFGFTAGAIMVGPALLISTWSNGLALLDEFTEQIRFADGFVFNTSGLSVAQQEIIDDIDGVNRSCPVGYLPLKLAEDQALGVTGMGPSNVICVGFETERFLKLNRIEFVIGTPEEAVPKLLEGDAVLVAEQFLLARNLSVGDTMRLGSGQSEREFEIAAVVSAGGLDIATQFFGMRNIYMEHAGSCVFMDFDAVQRHFDTRDAYLMQLNLDPGITVEQEEQIAQRIKEAVPGTNFASGRRIREIILTIGESGLTISSAVAVAALLLACFGTGNVIAAGIAARRFEFGVLRSVGSSRWLICRLVIAEAVVIGITGSVTGTLLGVHMAWIGTLLYQGLAGLQLQLVIPVGPAAIGWATVILLTVLAATPAVIALARRSCRNLLAAPGA